MNENWRWNLPVEKSIASMGWDPEGKVSIGYEDGSLSLLDVKEEKPGKDWSVDSRFPIVDHCWINKGSVCCTSGRNISIFDCEKNKQSTTLVGHLDVL